MVTVITCTIRDSALKNVFRNFLQQVTAKKELIIILNNDNMDVNKWKREAGKYKNISIYQLSQDVTLGSCFNFGVKKSRYRYVAKFDDDDYYAPNYLKTMLRFLTHTNADIVGKTSIYVYYADSKILSIHLPNQERRYCKHVAGATMVFDKSVFQKVRFPDVNKGMDQRFLTRCVKKGVKIYSADRFNFTCIRNPDKNNHTWKVSDSELLRYGKVITRTNNYKSYVVK
ncbi:Glycosyl transferase family 2 [Alteribacillus persepolensis]|uniref:Glycosyl transferase family 2 n=1 Tax=Alteribacillus persepolensis TaxID=568899 RepID=A0A1G8IQE5_9BACI|nr:glycosyltransferase family 2 protein [Alteribacillus persepolensis]SDI21176.1 Glycosyl transferase family 2 [Alteribacillus persepolensis]